MQFLYYYRFIASMIKTENIFIAVYGSTTVLVFILMTVFGGLFNSLHTVLFREISFIISPYSLYQDITVPMYKIYNTCLLLFSLVLCLRMKNTFAKLGALYLSMSAVYGLLLVEIPMDAIQFSRSLSGFSHVVVTLLTGIFMLVALLLFGYGIRSNKNLLFISRYSFAVSMVILITGFLTGVFALLNMPEYVGFIQKLPIAAFLFWIILTAVWMLRSDRRVHYAALPVKKKVKRRRF